MSLGTFIKIVLSGLAMATLISIGLVFYLVFFTKENWKWVSKFIEWSCK